MATKQYRYADMSLWWSQLCVALGPEQLTSWLTFFSFLFLPNKIVMELKELESAAGFSRQQSGSSAPEAQPRIWPPSLSLSLCWATLELIKLRDELDCCDIPATFFYIKFIVTKALLFSFFFLPSHPHLLFALPPFLSLSLSLIKRGRSRHRLELSASLKRGWASCMKLIIQNGFSQTEKNSCLHYLNASPFPAPLIGSLITGRGARWLIRTRLLVK